MKTIREILLHFGGIVLKDLEDPIKFSCVERTGTSIWDPIQYAVRLRVELTTGVSLWVPVLRKSRELKNENN